MCGQRCYLLAKVAVSSVFDPHVPVDTKIQIIAALKMATEEDNMNSYVLNPKESTGVLNKGPESFICVKCDFLNGST